MQPPPQAGEGQELTWAARVWVARSPDGRSTAQPVSLSQLARAFAKGLLPPEVEVAIDGEWISGEHPRRAGPLRGARPAARA